MLGTQECTRLERRLCQLGDQLIVIRYRNTRCGSQMMMYIRIESMWLTRRIGEVTQSLVTQRIDGRLLLSTQMGRLVCVLRRLLMVMVMVFLLLLLLLWLSQLLLDHMLTVLIARQQGHTVTAQWLLEVNAGRIVAIASSVLLLLQAVTQGGRKVWRTVRQAGTLHMRVARGGQQVGGATAADAMLLVCTTAGQEAQETAASTAAAAARTRANSMCGIFVATDAAAAAAAAQSMRRVMSTMCTRIARLHNVCLHLGCLLAMMIACTAAASRTYVYRTSVSKTMTAMRGCVR